MLHQEKRWLGHVNASPTQPHLLSFCQEGPWEKVEHRIWVMNTKSHERWKIRKGIHDNLRGTSIGMRTAFILAITALQNRLNDRRQVSRLSEIRQFDR